ncbi:MAG TPA: helix-turn-helix domain-containing protein [Rhodothermales bacterium]
MRRWSGRFFSTTRGRVVQLLGKGPRSVGDLADALDLTPNAIRASLATLERDGLVREAGKRPAVRKPETLYSLSSEAEQLFPRAYDLLFNLLIHVLRDRLPEHQVHDILRATGRAVARMQPIPPGTLAERASRAVVVLQDLGGLPELIEENGRLYIRGERCPLASVVREHPNVCKLAEVMLTEIVGEPVTEICDRNGTPHCRFAIAG